MGIDHRLTTRRMAEFVADGYLRFDAIVPAEVNERGIDGIIESLLGPDPAFDHDWTHHIHPRSTSAQPLHVDAITDSDDATFDIQLFWYPHDVAPGERGTRFVPGTHLRRVRSPGLDRSQHIAGEQEYSGPAGTVVVFHHGLWHAGQPNPGDGHRWMHKVRLNPRVPQVRRWNTDHRNELVQRARLWRYLAGDDTYDVDHYLTRLEGRTALVGS